DSTAFLPEAQRTAQIRLAEELRQRVRERLTDAGATSDSEVVRGLMPLPLPTTALATPKLVAPPTRVATSSASNAGSDLKMTKVDTAPATTNLDLPLVEIGGPTPTVP